MTERTAFYRREQFDDEPVDLEALEDLIVVDDVLARADALLREHDPDLAGALSDAVGRLATIGERVGQVMQVRLVHAALRGEIQADPGCQIRWDRRPR